MDHARKSSYLLFKEIEPSKLIIIKATNAVTLVYNILQVFSGLAKKLVINSFCCFLFLNYGKKSQTVLSNAFNTQSK